jgi:TRAP transporter TAXI family solute receptor
MHHLMTIILLLAIGWFQHIPTAKAQTPEQRRAMVNDSVVGIIAARRQGTMTELAEDLRDTLESDDLRIVPLLGRGSIGNVQDLLFLRGVDLALVQSDVLNFYLDQGIEPNIDSKIRYLATIGPQKAHLLTRLDINSIEQLNGKRVNIGRENTGSFMSASLLLQALGLQVQPLNYGHKKALNLLKSGEIDAMFRMGGAPIPGMLEAKVEDGIHLIDIPADRVASSAYQPTTLTPESYPELVRAPVQSVKVQTLLASYNWPKGHPRYDNVAKFNDALVSNQDELRSGDYHPAWQELSVDGTVSGWRKFE